MGLSRPITKFICINSSITVCRRVKVDGITIVFVKCQKDCRFEAIILMFAT